MEWPGPGILGMPGQGPPTACLLTFFHVVGLSASSSSLGPGAEPYSTCFLQPTAAMSWAKQD